MVKCVIKFEDNQSGVFFGGQTLKGTVEITLDSAQKFRALRLTVNGQAKCKWYERRRHSQRNSWGFCDNHNRRNDNWNSRVKFHGKEVYLNSESYLFGLNIVGDSVEYPAGIHNFNFACLLPPGLPSSIEANRGSIRYNVHAVLDIPWGRDKEFTAPFNVVKVEDLNAWPHLRVPREAHTKKSFITIPCGGIMLIQATVPVAGFVPGETIPVEIDYKNTTGLTVQYTKVTMLKSTEYLSMEPYQRTKWDKNVKVLFAKGPGFQPNSAGKILCPVVVAPTSSSNGHCSNVIKVSYSLKITCKVGGFHFSPTFSMPITIGNVAFSANTLLYDPNVFVTNAPNAPMLPMGPNAPMLPMGSMGPMGPMSPMGPMGPNGSMGPMGPNGSMGPMGPNGSMGPMGPNGPMNDLPPSFEAATGKYDKSIEAGQPPAHNPEWNNSLNSSNAPSAPSF